MPRGEPMKHLADEHAEIGRLVLAANLNFKIRPLRTILAAFLFGRRERIEHLGRRFSIAHWRGLPYLMSIREL
ncbi:hypothetical protein LX70_02662 [Defluviimonas denitrificans]|uniref:Uncharacterized protein n=2 Tax=Albidovulum denitrificans TaxID=404881 RepID=A0A2S8S6H5_9RHOB|nr:hypothetical protein LX70_02662 [Defluviimonas denitrificans]